MGFCLLPGTKSLDWPFLLLNILHRSLGVICHLLHHPCYIESGGKIGHSNDPQDSELQQVAPPRNEGNILIAFNSQHFNSSLALQRAAEAGLLSRVSSSTLVGDVFTGPPGSEKQFAFRKPCSPLSPLLTRCLQ